MLQNLQQLKSYLIHPLKNLTVPPFILDARDVNEDYDKEYIKAVEAQKKIPGSIFYPKRNNRKSSKQEKVADLSNIVVKRVTQTIDESEKGIKLLLCLLGSAKVRLKKSPAL